MSEAPTSGNGARVLRRFKRLEHTSQVAFTRPGQRRTDPQQSEQRGQRPGAPCFRSRRAASRMLLSTEVSEVRTWQERKQCAPWAFSSLMRRFRIGSRLAQTRSGRMIRVNAAAPSPQHISCAVPEIHTSDGTLNRVHGNDGKNESRARHGRCSRWSGGWQPVVDRTGRLLLA